MTRTKPPKAYRENASNSKRWRITVAAAIAPWAIVPIVALWILVGIFDTAVEVANGDAYFIESFVTYLSFVVLWSLVGVGIAYVATITYGIPVYLTLIRFKHESLQSIVLAGMLGSGLLAIVVNPGLLAGVVFVACGIAVSAVFWNVVNR